MNAYPGFRFFITRSTAAFLLLLLGLLSVSCDKDDICPRGKGPMVTRTFYQPAFEGVDFSSSGRVEIIRSTEYKVEIEAQENIIGCYRLSVQGGVLKIGTDKHFRPRKEPVIRIYTDKITQVNLSGSGSISSTGDFQSNHLDVRISGSGSMHLYSVQANSCYIRISGSGSCEVTAQQQLEVHISGSGNVYYKGQPVVSQHVSGSGNVIPLN